MFRYSRYVVCVHRYGVTFRNGGNFSTSSAIATKTHTKISDYYADKSVFITGGTGFLGKVFIERLLYNCKDIDKIFVLIRPKKGEDVGKRLNSLLDVPLFEKLKGTRPNDLKKVVAIEGDITSPELGIKDSDRQRLVDEVSVVFHSAATVRFADTFDHIMNVNFEGTRKVMDLSKNIKNLDTFVYISTAYSHSNRQLIEEKLYPPPKDLEEMRLFIRNHGTDEKRVQEYLDGYPNTYALSKAMCEGLVDQHKEDMPSIIVRPSIVSPVLHEPLKGWADSWVAATALFSNIARGLVPIMYGRKEVVCDLIPVDYVTNLTILAGAKGNDTKDVLVYNICSSAVNPITWKQAADLFLEESKKHGYSKKNERKILLTMSPFVSTIATFLLQTVPSIISDAGLILRGKKPWHFKEQSRAVWLRDLLYPFSTTSWTITCNNSLDLIDTLSEEERKKFNCDPKNINWNEYLSISCKGVREYLLKNKIKE